MKPSGYESCYNAIMAAKLERPHVYQSFIEYFDTDALAVVRDTYGIDLYRDCLTDATEEVKRKNFPPCPCESCPDQNASALGACNNGFGICRALLDYQAQRYYGIEKIGYGKRARYCIKCITQSGMVLPTNGKAYSSIEEAQASADDAGIPIRKIGDLWEIV